MNKAKKVHNDNPLLKEDKNGDHIRGGVTSELYHNTGCFVQMVKNEDQLKIRKNGFGKGKNKRIAVLPIMGIPKNARMIRLHQDGSDYVIRLYASVCG